MKARFAQWAQLGSPAKTDGTKTTQIRVMDLPNIRSLEDKLLLYSSTKGDVPEGVERFAESISVDLFGITRRDTVLRGYQIYYEASNELDEFEKESLYLTYENQFETTDMSDDEAVTVLKRLGLDFTDERGFPLRCLNLLCRQAEVAAKGIMGKMPDQAEASVNRWSSALQDAANSYLAAKRRGQ